MRSRQRLSPSEPEPTTYWLSTLPEQTPLNELLALAHLRWRIERDYQELTQELGLGHYEGRGWRGFHHHARLSIAACGFLIDEQLTTRVEAGSKRSSIGNLLQHQVPALLADYMLRGSLARAKTGAGLDRNAAPWNQRTTPQSHPALPVLRPSKRKATLVTQ